MTIQEQVSQAVAGIALVYWVVLCFTMTLLAWEPEIKTLMEGLGV